MDDACIYVFMHIYKRTNQQYACSQYIGQDLRDLQDWNNMYFHPEDLDACMRVDAGLDPAKWNTELCDATFGSCLIEALIHLSLQSRDS